VRITRATLRRTLDGSAFEILLQQGPVDDGGRFLVHAIVPQIGHYADDFAPIVLQSGTDTLADSQARVVPQLARQVLRYQRHGAWLYVSVHVRSRPAIRRLPMAEK
jgi:hypothetical protein